MACDPITVALVGGYGRLYLDAGGRVQCSAGSAAAIHTAGNVGSRTLSVSGLDAVLDRCYAAFALPSASGVAAWARPGRAVAAGGLST